jgi:hypothetical protein
LLQHVRERATPELKAVIGARAAAFREQVVGEKRLPATELCADSGPLVGFN